MQGNAKKSKQKGLDFLGNVLPNRDFSMSYEQKNKKISSASELAFRVVRRRSHQPLLTHLVMQHEGRNRSPGSANSQISDHLAILACSTDLHKELLWGCVFSPPAKREAPTDSERPTGLTDLGNC
jgi:hypothetical protein